LVTPLPPVPRRFWRTAVVFRRRRPPCFVRNTGSSSRELRSPPEFFRFSPARPAPSTFREVWSLFATSAPGVLCLPGFRSQQRSILRVSHPLDGLLLHVPCELVSSRYRVQGSRFRGFLPRVSRKISSIPRSLSPLAPTSCWWVTTSASHRRVDLRALLRPGIRSERGRFSPGVRPYPLVRLCSLGLCFEDLGRAMNAASARGLPRPVLRVPRPSTLSVSSISDPIFYP
jgi:hypothetical protein